MKSVLKKVFNNENLSEIEAYEAMSRMVEAKDDPIVVAGFLGALSSKGIVKDELLGFVKSLREHSNSLDISSTNLIDTAGTGGDGADTFNISTTACFILAAAGLAVCKHGNRSVSSKCGSADVIEALGINVDGSAEEVAKSIDTKNFGFIFAPKFHPSLKNVAPIRKALAARTVFNILGPLVNPSPVKRQIIGVFDKKYHQLMAEVLRDLGSEEVLLVTGQDGLDEFSLVKPTHVTHLKNNDIISYVLKPEDLLLERCSIEDLKGGDAKDNALITEEILSGKKGPKTDIVHLNAGAALMVGGLAKTLQEGILLSREIVESQKAIKLLRSLQNG